MKFYFDNDIFSDPGDPIHILYSPIVEEDGTINLVPSGKENTDDIIQSFAQECDINVIIAKYINGDDSVLNQKIGAYGDFTNVPKTLAEMLQMQINAKELFDTLPVDIKKQFDNDVNKFFVTSGSEEWIKIMEPIYSNYELKNVSQDNEKVGESE